MASTSSSIGNSSSSSSSVMKLNTASAYTSESDSTATGSGVGSGVGSGSGASGRLPGEATMMHAARWALDDDKPISMDYWADSLTNGCIIGVRENAEKMLVKSADEFTTIICRVAQSGGELLVATENTIYIVCKDIPRKRVR